MSNRFETTLDAHLARLLVEKLRKALETAGFRQTLQLAEPHLSEFQKESDVITLRTGHAGSHEKAVSLESESIDVNPLVELATRDTLLEVSARLLDALPWIDSTTALRRIGSELAGLMPGPK